MKKGIQSLKKMKTINLITKKIKLTAITCFIIFAALTATSCSNNDKEIIGDCDGVGWIATLGAAANEYGKATKAYNENQSSENCKNYKTAMENYIKAFETVEDCITGIYVNLYKNDYQVIKVEIENFSC